MKHLLFIIAFLASTSVAQAEYSRFEKLTSSRQFKAFEQKQKHEGFYIANIEDQSISNLPAKARQSSQQLDFFVRFQKARKLSRACHSVTTREYHITSKNLGKQLQLESVGSNTYRQSASVYDPLCK